MANDKDLHDLVKEYGNENYFSITYFTLRLSKMAPVNDYGVMTANDHGLTLYFLKNTSLKIKKENITKFITIPYGSFTELKMNRFLFFNNFRLKYTVENKDYSLHLVVSNHTLGIKKQKENAIKLKNFLKQYKLEHKI